MNSEITAASEREESTEYWRNKFMYKIKRGAQIKYYETLGQLNKYWPAHSSYYSRFYPVIAYRLDGLQPNIWTEMRREDNTDNE